MRILAPMERFSLSKKGVVISPLSRKHWINCRIWTGSAVLLKMNCIQPFIIKRPGYRFSVQQRTGTYFFKFHVCENNTFLMDSSAWLRLHLLPSVSQLFLWHSLLPCALQTTFMEECCLWTGPDGAVVNEPDKRLSPHNNLLPPDSGIFPLGDSSGISLRQPQSAISTFFNSPHPLEILKDGRAYGPKGSMYWDHDVNSYLRSVRAVVRKEVRRLREAERERWPLLWWPLVVQGMLAGAIGQQRYGLFVDAVVQGGRETVRPVRSHTQLLVEWWSCYCRQSCSSSAPSWSLD